MNYSTYDNDNNDINDDNIITNYSFYNNDDMNMNQNDNDINTNADINDIITNINETIDPNKLIETYKNLMNNLKVYKNQYKSLVKKNKYLNEYRTNLSLNHFKFTDIVLDNNNEITNIFTCYSSVIESEYNKWVDEIYIPTLNKLEMDIENLEIKIGNYRNFFVNNINEFFTKEKHNKKICSICFENEVDMCAIPCGHTCCNNCIISSRVSNYNNNNRCLNCRNQIQDYIKIYFLV
jgi:hypothetical protein